VHATGDKSPVRATSALVAAAAAILCRCAAATLLEVCKVVWLLLSQALRNTVARQMGAANL
jgi:hypothetical protein